MSSIEDGTFGFELRPKNPVQRYVLGNEVFFSPDEDGDGRPEVFLARALVEGEDLVLRGEAPIAPESFDLPLHRFLPPPPGRIFPATPRVLASAGDVNADGTPDYLIGFPAFPPLEDPRESRVFLVFGGFERDVLSVSRVEPRRGPVAESLPVTITGTGFATGFRSLLRRTVRRPPAPRRLQPGRRPGPLGRDLPPRSPLHRSSAEAALC